MKFHHYLYGQEFTCQSGHNPLEVILLKNFSDAPPVLQRLLLKIQSYDFVTKYVPGIRIPMADALSRVSPQEKGENWMLRCHHPWIQPTPHQSVCKVNLEDNARRQDTPPPNSTELGKLAWTPQESTQDIENFLAAEIWPCHKHSYIMQKSGFIIPAALRSMCLQTVHNGIQASPSATKSFSSMNLPTINKEIADHVQSSVPCQTTTNCHQKEPAILMDVLPCNQIEYYAFATVTCLDPEQLPPIIFCLV